MEYRLELVQGSASSTTVSFIAYKMHDRQRLDDRVVNANGGAGEVACDCKWWGTIGLLCRHALTVMHHLATFGCVKFQTLPSIYIKDRWKRSARTAFHIVIQRPLSCVENEEEWFVRASAEFGAIVRKAVRFKSLRPLIDLKANELACMIQESLLIIDAHSVVNPRQVEQNRSVPLYKYIHMVWRRSLLYAPEKDRHQISKDELLLLRAIRERYPLHPGWVLARLLRKKTQRSGRPRSLLGGNFVGRLIISGLNNEYGPNIPRRRVRTVGGDLTVEYNLDLDISPW
ncbi:hypothetical protein LINPERPRIM_LOCUS20330 [Linum perenne]